MKMIQDFLFDILGSIIPVLVTVMLLIDSIINI
ncbi:hypothetical protein J2S01_002587 [Pectinatus haikarae]|uniref:NADH dehydrogenase subunit 1 n=1 Tax=Pectinatus haikarae TaxID=349096 RepID=A0ABT9YB30_9FIRM|nr:hypothetical protein [Pectinatus haikarae]